MGLLDTISLHASWPLCLWCNPVSFKRHHWLIIPLHAKQMHSPFATTALKSILFFTDDTAVICHHFLSAREMYLRALCIEINAKQNQWCWKWGDVKRNKLHISNKSFQKCVFTVAGIYKSSVHLLMLYYIGFPDMALVLEIVRERVGCGWSCDLNMSASVKQPAPFKIKQLLLEYWYDWIPQFMSWVYGIQFISHNSTMHFKVYIVYMQSFANNFPLLFYFSFSC